MNTDSKIGKTTTFTKDEEKEQKHKQFLEGMKHLSCISFQINGIEVQNMRKSPNINKRPEIEFEEKRFEPQ